MLNKENNDRNREMREKIDELKARINPIDFYQTELTREFRPRRQAGWVVGGLCPFHDDNNPGSFHVNLDGGAFKCFRCEAKGGDIIAFRQLRDGLTFSEAVYSLINQGGLHE